MAFTGYLLCQNIAHGHLPADRTRNNNEMCRGCLVSLTRDVKRVKWIEGLAYVYDAPANWLFLPQVELHLRKIAPDVLLPIACT